MRAPAEIIWDLFRSPSAFRGEPWKYARNQIGHTAIVGYLPGLLARYASAAAEAAVPGTGWVPMVAIAAATSLFYVTWETLQFVRFHAELDDCLEDCGHVATGFLAGATGNVVIFAPQALLIGAGTAWRFKGNGDDRP